jgi:hypothetical protein
LAAYTLITFFVKMFKIILKEKEKENLKRKKIVK